jgi:hypothetical protein
MKVLNFAMAGLLAIMTLGTGCVTFSSLTPGSASDKGVWVQKSKYIPILHISLMDDEIFYCAGGARDPNCAKATGTMPAAK